MTQELTIEKIFQEIEKFLKNDLFYDALKLATIYSKKDTKLLENSLFLNLVGFINLNLKDWDTAIISFKKAINLNKNFQPAYLNLAIALYDLGKLKDSYKNLTKILHFDQNNKRIKENIIKILNHIDIKSENEPLAKANHELQKVKFDFDISKKIDDSEISNLVSKSKMITSNFINDFAFREHQLFIHNRRDLNCERHMKIFKKYKTISRNCFSCFKIVLHIQEVYDLIKLSILFNKLKILDNFEMKCRINPKENNYRGYIYCDNVEELESVSTNLKYFLDINFESKYKLEKRRGCSEFSEVFHKFKKINSDPKKMFQYKEDWKKNEKIIDNQIYKNGNPISRNVRKPLKGMTLNYFLVINNWINFSKTILDK